MARSSSQNLVFIILGILCVVAWWFYRPQIVSFWNSGVRTLAELSFSSDAQVVNNTGIVEETKTARDCGIGTAPDLKNPSTYSNNPVLNCLGNSALSCQNARGILNDTLFPTIFQIGKDEENTCYFKLSYSKDSALVDITSKRLASQYIFCPLNAVKSVDESNPDAPLFKVPDKNKPGKYGSQIYFYGTLGVFVEQDLDKNKIRNLGCSGPYIDSVIASYRKMQSKN